MDEFSQIIGKGAPGIKRGLWGAIPFFVLSLLWFGTIGSAKAATNWIWIWAADGTHPPETLYFRQRFKLARRPLAAHLLITADDSYTAYLNDRTASVASGNDWTTVQEFDVTRFLKAGDNLLAVQCRNISGQGGLLFKLVVKLSATRSVLFFSDTRVRVNRHPPVVWNTLALNDRGWAGAHEIAPANGGIWGLLRGAPVPDYSRIVRQWDIRGTGVPGSDPYSRPRASGERMLLSSSVASISDMHILAGLGFSLLQTDSDHLSTEEVAAGKWDWLRADAARSQVRRLGLDWSYAEHEAFPPKWFRDNEPFTRIQCLEHHQTAAAFSPWDPTWSSFIDRGYAALGRAFGPKAGQGGLIRPAGLSAICVGVHGDYGEAGLLTGARVSTPEQKAGWNGRFGNVHDHLGFWCDDALARADFRDYVLQRYGSLAAVNHIWNTDYATPNQITYPADPTSEPSNAHSKQQIDFIFWYRQGVGKAIEANLSAARKQFPNTLLMVRAGFPDENVRGGNDNSLIPKLAARYNAAVRSLHGAFRPFDENSATMLGRIGSACRFYGAPLWTESPGMLTSEQTVQRIYEAASQGAAGYFDWAENAVANRDVYYTYGKYLRTDRPIVDVAMFYPAQAQSLRPDQGFAATFAHGCAYLRNIADFDIVDDRMVLDNALANYRVLALWEGMQCEQATLDKIKAWVDNGGVLVAYDFGKVTNFNGDEGWFRDLFGYYQDLKPPQVTRRYAGELPTAYRIDVGRPELADYMEGTWMEPHMDRGVTRRWTGPQASILLPVEADKSYALVVRARMPQEASALRHELYVNGRKLGDLSAIGDARYRFLLPDSVLDTGEPAVLTFRSETFSPARVLTGSKDTRELGIEVESIELAQQGKGAPDAVGSPPGAIRQVLDLGPLKANDSNGSWVRRYGNGLTIYFPANRSLLKGYMEVLRQAIYHLSAIDPARRNAIPIDDNADGVIGTLFPDKILYYNPFDNTIVKKLTIPAADFAAWKNEILPPAETSWTLQMKPHSIEAVYFTPPPQELLYQCEGFTSLGGLKPQSSPDCSPGEGLNCVKIPAGSSISTRFRVTLPGAYRLYVRTLYRSALEPIDILIDGHLLQAGLVRAGAVLSPGIISLTQGAHTLQLRTRAGRPVRADFILLSNDPTVNGYNFAIRTAPVE